MRGMNPTKSPAVLALLLLALSSCYRPARTRSMARARHSPSPRCTAPAPRTNVTAALLDVTQSDTGAVIADYRRPLGITHPPLKIELNYDPAKIQPGHKYAVHARLEDPGNITLQTPRPVPVFAGEKHEDTVTVTLTLDGPDFNRHKNSENHITSKKQEV